MPVIVGVALWRRVRSLGAYAPDRLIEQRSDADLSLGHVHDQPERLLLIGFDRTLDDRHHLPARVRIGLVMA
jgi:hypothetical protein